MNLNNLPKEIRDEPIVHEAIEKMTEAFYGIIKDCARECIDKTPEAQKSDILKYSYRTMLANACKTAFDNAYMRYLTQGITED